MILREFTSTFLEIFSLFLNFEIIGLVSKGFTGFTPLGFLSFKFAVDFRFFEISSSFFALFFWGWEFKGALFTDKIFLLLFTLLSPWSEVF